jgi:xanthine dehydrogenase FAD-binding subunit
MFEIKEYKKANSVKEAVSFLAKNPDAKLIAGGTDVLIKLREGKKGFTSLIDIHGLKELKFVELTDNGDIKIGSAMTFSLLTENEIILKHTPIIALAAGTIGGPQIRNVATIGGNLCNGAISADSIGSLFVLDAILEIEGISGVRTLPITQFYLGPGKVAIEHDEILKSIIIKKGNYDNYGAYYYKYAPRNAMDIATIGCAASCKLNKDIIDNFKIAFTVAAPKPLRCIAAEKFAKGQKISEKLIDDIAQLVIKDLKPRDSWRASKDFRVHIIKTLAKRVTYQTVKNAGADTI